MVNGSISQRESLMENIGEPQVKDAGRAAPAFGLEPLVLASASPRRAEILRTVAWPYEGLAANVDETREPDERPEDYVKRLALMKAEAVASRRLSQLVLGADTVVVVEESVLGKPRDRDDARRMLRMLRGRWHEVLTGVALVRAGSVGRCVACERTRVRFAAMSESEIEWYAMSDEPLDKAGAYAVQGRGALFIEAIEGNYWNVVGLPIGLVYKLARELSGAGIDRGAK